MSYSKTVWLETSMSTAQKLSGLDNLESMYGEATSYIDAITHSERYYTEAQCSKYFTSATDGSGTGLIAATLDGYTADQITAAGTPSGVIAWWSGSEASIPDGWLLCNGLNSTPDLRDRFVPGAGSHYSKGDTGGADTATTSATVTIAGHALTTAEIAKHTHQWGDYYNSNFPSTDDVYGAWVEYASVTTTSRTTGNAGGGGSHSHTATFSGDSGQDKRPSYYAVCFIMKS